MHQKISLVCITAIFMVAVMHAQFYSRTFPVENRQTFIATSVIDGNGYSYTIEMLVCENNNGCLIISKIDDIGQKTLLSIKNYMRGNPYVLNIRNDTLFYSGRNNADINGHYNWYFGMMSTTGDSLAEYIFPVITDTIPGVDVINYGLTLVGSRQVILWGEGRNPAEPDAAARPFQSVFLRVDFDGNVLSGPRFWQLHPERDRRMTDAVTDKEGNMVFGYAWWKEGQGYNRGVFKMNHQDSIYPLVQFESLFHNFDNPDLTIDNTGNYITIAYNNWVPVPSIFPSDIPIIIKFDSIGNELWRNYIRPNDFDWLKGINYGDFRVLRMNVCQNNDILICGGISINDTFPLPGTNTWVKSGAPSSFMARFSVDGDELWRHIIVHPQPDGKLGYNGLHNISEAPDGSIIVSGTLQRVYDGPRINDSWVMRLSSDGCLNESCDHVGRYWMFPDVATSTDDRTTSESLTLYPNPGTTWLRWMSPASMTYPVRYSLTNLQGIQTETGYIPSPDAAQLNTDYLPAGMYILTMTDKSGRRYLGKWVKG